MKLEINKIINILKKYIKKLDKVNKIFIIISLIFTIIFIGLFIVICLSCMKGDLYTLHVGLCGIFASFASALDIAIALRIIDLNRYIKQYENAKKSLMPAFLAIYTMIDCFFPEILAFVKIRENDTISFPDKIIYYTDKKRNFENRSFFDFEKDFNQIHKKLDENIDKCLGMPIFSQCEDEIIELLTQIKLCEFLNCFDKAIAFEKINAPVNSTISGIYKSFIEFSELYEKIGELVSKKNDKILVALEDKTKQKYIEEIKKYSEWMPIQSDRIYFGGIRIK